MKKNNSKKYISKDDTIWKIILDICQIVGALGSVVAIVLSCHANNISENALFISQANEANLQKIECIEKVSNSVDRLCAEYRSIIANITTIKQFKTGKDVDNAHDNLLNNTLNIKNHISDIYKISKRYNKKCSQSAQKQLSLPKNLAQTARTLNMKQFEKIEYSELMNHLSMLNELYETDFGIDCCTITN